MNPKKPKVLKSKPKPTKLLVKFPIMETPRQYSQTKMNQLINHIRKMSNEQWTFVFETPDFMEITK